MENAERYVSRLTLLEEGGNILVFYEDVPKKEEFFDLFETTGWNEEEYHLSADQLHQAISHSWYAVSAYEDDRLIGFGRVISDGMLHAFIVDMIVHPDHQGKGLGRRILEKLVSHCQEAGINDIQLFCATGKSDFYKKSGFEPRPQDAPGMQYKGNL